MGSETLKVQDVQVESKKRRGIWPALGLVFVAPLVAEFLLGNLPIKLLPALIVLAPMYGGGALLIREAVRRTGRGWPSILLLGMAYAIFEEAYTTQSLFNPNYLKLNLGLLTPAYIPSLGISAWWTLWMFMVHGIWSISTPIALVEACVPDRARTPWLGRVGLVVVALCFCLEPAQTRRSDTSRITFWLQWRSLWGGGGDARCWSVQRFDVRKRREDRGHWFGAIGVDGGRGCAGVWVGGAVCSKELGMGSGGSIACAGCGDVGAGVVWSRRSGWGLETSARTWGGRGAGVRMARVSAASGGGWSGSWCARGERDFSGRGGRVDLVRCQTEWCGWGPVVVLMIVISHP